MSRASRMMFLAVLSGLLPAAGASPGSWTLTRGQWSGADEARQVIALAPVRAAVAALDANPGAKLVLVHNGGESGIFWASNLKGWLIALGVPAARIVDRTGAVPANELRLKVISGSQAAGP